MLIALSLVVGAIALTIVFGGFIYVLIVHQTSGS